MERSATAVSPEDATALKDTLADGRESPFECVAHAEVRARVEEELRQVSEPYRTTVILRDLEEMSYEEIAEITQVSLGTVKSRLTRGREALRRRLAAYVIEVGPELGLEAPSLQSVDLEIQERRAGSKGRSSRGTVEKEAVPGRQFEVAS